MAAAFLELPIELRLQIYDCFLADHQYVSRRHQPNNAHIRLLHVCRQITDEAALHYRRYISLRTEHQINAFIYYATPQFAAQIEWADVVNDGRVFHSSEADDDQEDTPLSNLHLALARMTALWRLRVFQCTQGLPINLNNTMDLHRSRRLGLKFERAMFPRGPLSLSSYELYLNAETRVDLYDAVDPSNLVALRFSGEIIPSDTLTKRGCEETPRQMPRLRHVILHSITGNHFDRHTVDDCFPGAQLESFTYALGHRLGFEIRNHHIESLASGHGQSLRKLVLLGCSRLSSTTITQALENMPYLEYFALHLVTVDELRSNFIRSLPMSLAVLKLQVMNAWYAVALTAEERSLCEAIESNILLRDPPLQHICASFRASLMMDNGRHDRWELIAASRGVRLDLGPWEHEMVQDV
ncbi:hypothetical protein L227DRAFT_650090 [Lentinus tigrinus ALCF2SS1-6]|uniref:2EXR domain-containing protein n=1 Tax=Lentinus tigrinus ALCF2SS1-6 TaxID=1328759 RepID=A0A5C2SMV2_9APHY|nr:hypothetical protein L227DRAFT_650090 [Lentinus tigrinus ALCF2SS1-6]